MLVMNNSEQIAFQLTYLQDKKSLILRWCWVLESGCYCVTVHFAYNGCQSVDDE